MGAISEEKKRVDIKKKKEVIIIIQLYIKGKNIYISLHIKNFISILFFLWEYYVFNKIYVRHM